jgi:uncharacterized membrane protein
MTTYTLIFLVSSVTFSVIDFVWVGLIAKRLYRRQIGHLLRDKPNVVAAVIFYILYIIGLIIFVINPALQMQGNQILNAAVYGGLYGLFTYATYDLTNLATVKGWPLLITIIDMIWGIVISTITAIITVLIFV